VVLLEAAACARPLIATRVRGCTEIVRDGKNGLLVPARDSAALAQAIRTLVTNKELRVKMGAQARNIVMKEFRVEHISAETLALYRGLVGHGYVPSSLAHTRSA
jgi:glycosyltransferase involved in cell wall biosynthesis